MVIPLGYIVEKIIIILMSLIISEDLIKLKFIVSKQIETQVAIFYIRIRDVFVVLAADVLLFLKRGWQAIKRTNEFFKCLIDTASWR